MKKLEIKGSNIQISDGYHTFDELYDHRCLLWINLCLILPGLCGLIEDHFDGWFLLYMDNGSEQISYHCPNKYLYLVKGKIQISKEYEYDGHTSQDVIERLINMTKRN